MEHGYAGNVDQKVPRCSILGVKKFENAFITGASSGIGRVLAKKLGSRGTRVVVAARRQVALESLVASIRDRGGAADVCLLDVADSEATLAAIRHWNSKTGGLDLVVANAGVSISRHANELKWEHVAPVVRVNVLGAFATIVAGLECMEHRGKGTLVGVSSLAGMRGFPRAGAYPASKAALSTFLETLRADLDGKGIAVVDVRPGFVDTAMTRQNKFKMPFLMAADRAAELTLKGIERGDAIVAYPWPTAAAVSVAQSIPNGAWRLLSKTMR